MYFLQIIKNSGGHNHSFIPDRGSHLSDIQWDSDILLYINMYFSLIMYSRIVLPFQVQQILVIQPGPSSQLCQHVLFYVHNSASHQVMLHLSLKYENIKMLMSGHKGSILYTISGHWYEIIIPKHTPVLYPGHFQYFLHQNLHLEQRTSYIAVSL